MRFDIDRMQAFYASPLGRMAQDMIARRVAALWPDATGQDVLGFGHAAPLLDPYRAGARRVIAASPGQQGAVFWPPDGKGCAVLTEEERLPFQDALFDRLIVVHGLEEADSPPRLLREFWRVCAPEARILIVVAHRRGLWTRAESTPFGQGRSYTRSQLNGLLEDAMFQPAASARALHAPPINIGLITSAGDAWEKIGKVAWAGFGGVLMIEAVKRLYIEPTGRKARVMKPARAPARSAIPAAREGKTADSADFSQDS